MVAKTARINLCRDGDGDFIPRRGGKYHLGRKQGAPFASSSVVSRCAADEFVGPRKVFDESGRAETRDGGGLKNEGIER